MCRDKDSILVCQFSIFSIFLRIIHVHFHLNIWAGSLQNPKMIKALYLWSNIAVAPVLVPIPVTLLAAEKEPILSGRSLYLINPASRCLRSILPSASSSMVTTSQTLSLKVIHLNDVHRGQ